MLYKINRTSGWSDEQKPCDEAFKKKFKKFHERTCTEEEFNSKYSYNEGLWRSKGTNHSITTEGNIRRQEGYEILWCIKLSSLKQLKDFIEKYGHCVIDTDSIEIYDDWRE